MHRIICLGDMSICLSSHTLGCPGKSLSKYVATWNCNNCANSEMICAGAPFLSCFLRFSLCRIIIANWWVKSSCTQTKTLSQNWANTIRRILPHPLLQILEPTATINTSITPYLAQTKPVGKTSIYKGFPVPRTLKRKKQQKRLASLLEEVSIITDGLTGGGGIGRTCRIIQSGRAYLGFKPNSWQSSSLILFRTLRTCNTLNRMLALCNN